MVEITRLQVNIK